jgi:polysaccharide export outer membrane protein
MKTLKVLVVCALSSLSSGISAQETYRLNPGDVLQISVWNEDALQQEVMVLPDGSISFPLVGILNVTNKTPGQVQKEIKQRLSALIPDPEINLMVSAVEGNNIFIIGKVLQPGRYLMTRPTDVVQALTLAGGFTPYAETENIYKSSEEPVKSKVLSILTTRKLPMVRRCKPISCCKVVILLSYLRR